MVQTSGLARDVERYLSDEPVAARPPSLEYQLRKFARRNRVLLITVTLVTASLLIGAGGAIWQAHLARREAIQAGIARQEAQKEADRANSILERPEHFSV